MSMIDYPILSVMTFLPLIGALLITMIRGLPQDTVDHYARWVALLFSGFVFVLSLSALKHFDPTNAGYQFVEKAAWFPALSLNYHMGVDGLSIYFVVLSAFLTPVCIISAWSAVKTRVKEYMIAFLVLETFMIGTFCALDAVLFYVFFEGVLIPMFLIIGVWGGKNRIYASFKFFLYTLLGSVLMLVALLYMYAVAGTTDIPTLAAYDFAPSLQFWLFLAFFASFAVKMPMWPVHTWLPDAHVEAPTAGSVILAGVLLKMGGYGFLRFSLPMFPDASTFFAPYIMGLSIIAIIYTSLIALVQDDMKKLIAYSSVAHMGFVTMGIFSGTVAGVQGAMFQMLSHGIISAALFLCVGVVYDRMHTREIKAYGGIVGNMPRYAVVFMILMLGSVGLPGTSGFVGEFLALLGAFHYSTWVAALAGLGVVLGAAYMLRLYRAVIFGPRVNADAIGMPDLSAREFAMFIPFVIMTIAFGVMPGHVLRASEATVHALIPQTVGNADISPRAQLAALEAKGTIPMLERGDSLAGIDTNSNGVRDDIDAYIIAKYSDVSQRAAAIQVAKALQAALVVNTQDVAATKEVSHRVASAARCIFNRFLGPPNSEQPARVVQDLEGITTNTKARLLAYLAYNKVLDGTSSPLPVGDTCE